jgi:ribose transport system permease protein
LVDLLIFVAFGLASTHLVFFSEASITDILRDATEGVLLATGMALLLSAGEFDISLGANLILSSVLGGKVLVSLSGTSTQLAAGEFPHLAVGIVGGAVVCIASGLGMGLLNGLIVTRLRVSSLIATLATLGIATGTADIVTSGVDLANIPPSLQSNFGIRDVVGVIPLPALVAAAAVVVIASIVSRTRFGVRTLAIGSSRDAARRAGIRVENHLIALFTIAGGLGGIAGFVDISRFATTNISGHETDALGALAAAVIGGTSLFGGRISFGGAVCGALLAVVLEDGLVVVGFSSFYQLIAVGVVLIAAVFIDQHRQLFRRRGEVIGAETEEERAEDAVDRVGGAASIAESSGEVAGEVV